MVGSPGRATTCTTVRTFVDTNIWVYAHDTHNTAKRARAREVLRADPGGLWVSPQVMGELYVTLTRRLAPPMDPAAAGAIIVSLARLNVVSLEAAQVLEAIDLARGGQVAYWDALIVATARGAGCERILTEDLAAGSEVAGVRIENPFTSTHRLAEPPSPYAVTRDAWDDGELREQLGRYEATCRAAGMKPNAVHSYWDYARRFLDWREGLYPRHATARPVPRGVVGIPDLQGEVAEYERFLEGAKLGRPAIDTYVRHAGFFVRWLGGDFRPGGRLHRRR
jgi:predicted nucleic acid-binding protein